MTLGKIKQRLILFAALMVVLVLLAACRSRAGNGPAATSARSPVTAPAATSAAASPTSATATSPTSAATTPTPAATTSTASAQPSPTAAPASGTTPSTQASASTTNSCQVASVATMPQADIFKWLADHGTNPAHPGDLTTHPDANGVWQVYKVDPGNGSETCLSCKAAPGAPRPDQNKRYAFWDTQHKWIIVDSEMLQHPNYPQDRRLLNGALSNGFAMNLYAMSPDGTQWINLTKFQWNQVPPRGDRPIQGAFDPKFTHDGTKVVWTSKVQNPRGAATRSSRQLGFWELWMAQYSYDANGAPSLQYMTNISPKSPQGDWYEPHDFSPDDRWLLLTSDMNNTEWQIGQDIFRIDITGINLSSGDISKEVVQDLTNTPFQWDEHAFYSPDGKKIAWTSSSLNNDATRVENNNLRTEVMVMNADGSDKVQLTHFNSESGYPESTPGQRTIANTPIWSKDGNQILIQVGFAPTNQVATQQWIPPVTGGKWWLITLKSSC